MIKRMRPLLGTFVEVGIGDAGSLDEQQLHSAINNAFAAVENIQNLLSFHNPHSDLSCLNQAQGQWVTLHPLSIRCLKLARALTRISGGKFNCTLGKAIVDKGALPVPDYLNTLTNWLAIGDWRNIEITQQSARLTQPLLITLDGIAKGFAVDQAITQLQSAGVASAWVNAGGDIRVYGSTIIPISIRDHQGRNHPMGGLQNAAIATSTSNYTAEHPGLLLDANAQEIPIATWSVIAKTAARADALTKVAANVPLHCRRDYIRRFSGNWIAIDNATITQTTFCPSVLPQ